jgi:hypothetical protein
MVEEEITNGLTGPGDARWHRIGTGARSDGRHPPEMALQGDRSLRRRFTARRRR